MAPQEESLLLKMLQSNSSEKFRTSVTAGVTAVPEVDEDSLWSSKEDNDDYSGTSSSSGDGHKDSDREEDDGEMSPEKEAESELSALARRETNAVKKLRLLMVAILLGVTILASLGVFYFTKNSEETEFRNEFQSQGYKVISGYQDVSLRKLQSLESLSKSIVNYARASNSTWPFVTIPDTATLFQSPLDLTGSVSLALLPIVNPRQRAQWEAYSVEQSKWIEEDLLTAEEMREKTTPQTVDRRHTRDLEVDRANDTGDIDEEIVSSYIKNYVGIDTSPGPWVVWWQYAPVIKNKYFINFNRLATEGFEMLYKSLSQRKAVLSKALSYSKGLDFQSTEDVQFVNDLLVAGSNGKYGDGEPVGYIYYPVLQTLTDEEYKIHQGTTYPDESSENTEVDPREHFVAVLAATVYWKSYFEDILPDNVKGVVAVVTNTVGQSFTYVIRGAEASFKGMEDLHDPRFDKYAIRSSEEGQLSSLEEGTSSAAYHGVELDTEFVEFIITVYPSEEMERNYLTIRPILYLMAMLLIFLITVAIFVIYDIVVERRQKIVFNTALQSNAVVSSLFPESVRHRLFLEAAKEKGTVANAEAGNGGTGVTGGGGNKWKNVEKGGKRTDSTVTAASTINSSPPIADFFPRATVMFADIRGFTAWSSTREPTQVFILLETLYGAFDQIANKRRVFKVETIGDCYVAVAGLPQPRADHAIVMVRFAQNCLDRMRQLTRELETTLGPDTGDLSMRFGLHSGPVTAGVLRGERSRFQLFGDTMNTASRMESTGVDGRIQISQETADLLTMAGKEHWLVKREDKVVAKGKGELQTYFADLKPGKSISKSSVASVVESEITTPDLEIEGDSNALRNPVEQVPQCRTFLSEKTLRYVSWNVEVLRRVLKQIVARRGCNPSDSKKSLESSSFRSDNFFLTNSQEGTVLEEVKEVIELPEFDEEAAKLWLDPTTVQLSPEVEHQLEEFVKSIALMYRDVPFHNFEHASHVTMSVSKLLTRIIAPREMGKSSSESKHSASSLHDHTYGITSDPLTQFACLFSALIHDVDHTGVPNTQLIKENKILANAYKNRSVAEQNSVDLAWNVLSQDEFAELRETIYSNNAELQRFRQLVVNSVMATDIMDKDLKALRNARWEKAFTEFSGTVSAREHANRKATIVIEHLIQASDVAHTMQHWHIYRKWNELFFMECYQAYLDGRAENDPSVNWYKGEIGFFNFYIIPLADKLKDCGVFGVSGDEYLSYAVRNRDTWEARGEEVLSEMLEKLKKGKSKLTELKSAESCRSSDERSVVGKERLEV